MEIKSIKDEVREIKDEVREMKAEVKTGREDIKGLAQTLDAVEKRLKKVESIQENDIQQEMRQLFDGPEKYFGKIPECQRNQRPRKRYSRRCRCAQSPDCKESLILLDKKGCKKFLQPFSFSDFSFDS